jgi:hypothetical protein
LNGLCFYPLFVIPGEDPGSIVEHCLFQRPAVHSGSRLKAGTTKKLGRDDKEELKLQRAESRMHLCDIQADEAGMPENRGFQEGAMRWIDRIPMLWLVGIALYLAGAPFVPEPHLTEKWRMLLDGTLSKPIDIFDFFLHTGPLVVLAIRLWRDAQRRRQGKD